MDLIWLFLLIIVVFISIKDLMKSKKLPNDSVYNFYQNSRFYRLLILVVACIVVIIIVIVRKIIY